MYYLMTEYTLPSFAGNRELITIGNREYFTDMYDYHPAAITDKKLIMDKDSLEEFLKKGFDTKDEARKNTELKKAIVEFIGPFFKGSFRVVTEDDLRKKHSTLKF